MDLSCVVLKYSPSKWTAADDLAMHKHPLQPLPRKTHIVALSDTYTEIPIEQSLARMQNYAAELDTASIYDVENNWYVDVTNVAQRLKVLRDAFKVIQSVRKKKMMGERADFRSLYDTKTARGGSPALSDDDANGHTDDDDENRVPPPPPPTAGRRGRPRKKRGRERKVGLTRADANPVGRPPKRTRASRRLQEDPVVPEPRDEDPLMMSSVSTPEGGGVASREPSQEPFMASAAFPQSFYEPKLMHQPPILPSQRAVSTLSWDLPVNLFQEDYSRSQSAQPESTNMFEN